MVLLLPIFPDEETRLCSACGHIGIVSPIPQRSSYRRRDRGGFEMRCRSCNRARDRRGRERRGRERSPEENRAYAAHRRDLDRASHQRRKARDPEGYRARAAEIKQDYKRRRREMLGDGIREEARIDRALRRERSGVPLPVLLRKPKGGTIWYPPEPFQAWLRSLIETERRSGFNGDARRRIENQLGISQRRFTDWLVAKRIDETIVDYACSRHGGVSLFDLYPHGKDTVILPVVIWEPPPPPTPCADPHCDADAAEGRFCGEHGSRLARIRAELEADGAAMSAQGGVSRRKLKGRKGRPGRIPTCCAPTCFEPREAGKRFCSGCVDAGFTEDMFE